VSDPIPAARSWRALRIVHVALTAGLVVYGVVAAVAAPRAGASFAADPLWIIAPLGVVGAMLLALAPAVSQRMMPPRRRPGAGPAPGPAVLDSPAGRRAVTRAQRALITIWALYEAVAALGLIAALMLGDAIVLAPFGLVAILGLVAHAPRAALLQQILAALPDRTRR
jgi:hypothetical protein